MVKYTVYFTKAANKDKKRLKRAGLESKAKHLLNILKDNPYQVPPPYKKLVGNLAGFYSRRINIQHRLVYLVDDDHKVVKVLSMWSHYE
ncbi:MAG: Txe/YoeB family addiction module toxin [Clostridiales bacterium]|nr:MAG: Txe/YoeB family addiction module toxin [Clostridiales bacterium]